MSRQILTILSPDDQQRVLAAEHALAMHDQQRMLMAAGKRALWQAIREKYDLPKTFEWDRQSGACFEEVAIKIPTNGVAADG